MNASLAVVVLPGPGAPAATLESVRAEVDDETPVLVLTTEHRTFEESTGLVSATPMQALTAAEILAFIRFGDRWRPGTLAARLRPLQAHPTAVLGVAGHVIVDQAGNEVLTARSPMPPIKPNELLLHPSIEPAAVLVRSSVLDEAALDLIAAAHGDAVVWSQIVRRHGLLPSMEIAAEVALDADRHGYAPRARTEALLKAVSAGSTPEELGVSTVRRELLRRLYLEPHTSTDLAGIDLATLIAPEAIPAVIAAIQDLEWALERQRDALDMERLRWPQGEVEADDGIPQTTEFDLMNARLKAEELWHEIQVRNAEIARLQAEITRRDATIDRLSTAGQTA